MELKWRLLDARRVRVKINPETLSTEEIDALIRALGRVRAKMQPHVPVQRGDNVTMIGEAGFSTQPVGGKESPPATLSDALDAIAGLLAKAPEGGRDSVAGLLETFARIGQISRDGLAMLLTPPAANEQATKGFRTPGDQLSNDSDQKPKARGA